MSRLNYFEPYESKTNGHEDQLTRAFLVVLRYSSTALLAFYESIYKSCLDIAKQKKDESVNLPSIYDFELDKVAYATQKSDLTPYVANKILSVLITDEKFEADQEIHCSTREARYDGIISFSKKLLIIIENKPKSYDVWEEQLSPNLTNIETDGDFELIRVPAIIEWKDIIKKLNSLVLLKSLSGAEKLIIGDFLDYVNKNFEFLNPYDNLCLCKNSRYLIIKRMKNILLNISKDQYVKYHQGWGINYIATQLKEITMVGLTYEARKNNEISIEMHFGDTQSQSRNFYEKKLIIK